MSGGVLSGAPVRARRGGVRRDLLRLLAYQDLVLEDRARPPAGPVPASPVECAYEALAVVTLVFAVRGARRRRGRRGARDGAADDLAYLAALLARIAYPQAPERVGRVVFLGQVAEAVEGSAPAVHGFGLLRRELFAVLRRLRGERVKAGGGRSARAALGLQGLVVGLGVSVYYLGVSRGVFRRLAPPRPLPCPTSTTSPAPSPRRGLPGG